MKRFALVGFLIAAVAGVAVLLLQSPEGHAPRRDSVSPGQEDRDRPAAADDGADESSPDAAPDDDPNRIAGADLVLTGRVLRGGRGVAGATVEVGRAHPPGRTVSYWSGARPWSKEAPAPIAGTTCDDEGRFRIAVARRRRLVVSARAPGCSRVRKLLQAPPEGDPPEMILRLEEGSTLRGLVVDTNGEDPVAGVLVMLSDQGWRMPHDLVWTSTDAEGRFAFRDLGPGYYALLVRSEICPDLQRRVSIRGTSEVVVRLVEGGSILGTVTDAQGRPVTGAGLTFMTGHAHRNAAGPSYAETDESGAYRVELAAPGPVTTTSLRLANGVMLNSAAGNLVVPTELVVAGEELRFDIRLEPGVAVRGVVVVAETGRRVPDAKVTLLRLHRLYRGLAPVATQQSGPDGTFEFPYATPGTYALEAEGSFFARRVNREAQAQTPMTVDLFVDGRIAPPEQRVEVSACGSVVGRIEAGEREDFANVYVTMPAKPGQLNARTDDFGAFEFTHVAPGEGLVAQSWTPPAKSDPFDVLAGQVTEIVLDASRRGGFAGIVVDEAGTPLAGVIVKAVSSQNLKNELRNILAGGGSGWNSARTNSEGRFVVSIAEWVRKNQGTAGWRLAAVDEHHRLTLTEALEMPAVGETSETRIALDPGGRVRGIVELAGGGPAQNAAVWLMPKQDKTLAFEQRQSRNALTDSAGRFEFIAVAPGKYRLGASLAESQADPIEVEAGDGEARLVLRPRGFIRGVVVDEDGRPVTTGEVVALIPTGTKERRHRGSLDRNGRFAVVALPTGSFALEVSPSARGGYSRQMSPGFEKTRIPPVPTGSENVVIRVSSGARLEGRVVDPDGRPVSGAGIVALPQKEKAKVDARSFQTLHPWTSTNGRGEFLLKGLGSDPVELVVLASGHAPTSVTTSAGAGQVTIEVSRGGVIEGKVLRPDGTPVASQWISVQAADPEVQKKLWDWQRRAGQSWQAMGGWRLTQGQTDADGAFRLAGLLPGEYRVHMQVDDLVSPIETLRTDAGPITIRLLGGLSIRGRVLGPGGRPIDEKAIVAIYINARAGERWLSGTRPGVDGRFELTNLPPGRITVQTWGGAKYRHQTIEVVAGDHGVVLQLEENPTPPQKGR